jgi:diguanylate cyclase (GGDEF)-like protein/PAS domain S-box-containing protein
MQGKNHRYRQQSFWVRLKVWTLNRTIVWIVLFLCLLVTYLVWKRAQEDLLRAQQVQFDARIADVSEAIVSRLRTYEQVLRGGVGLFTASQSISRAEFQDYVASLEIQQQFAGIQGIGFALHVPAVGLDAHLKKLRLEGFPNYVIHPAGIRDQYTSIVYLEPFGWRNQRAFGFDMFTEANRRVAMESARDTGRASITSRVTLVQETDKAVQPGLLMYLPQYKNGAPRNTLAERRENLHGYVFIPFRLTDLMNGILKTKPGQTDQGIDLEIYDSQTPSASSLLYAEGGIAHRLGKSPKDSLTRTRSIDLYGHTWHLYFTTRTKFHTTFDQSKLLYLLGFGTLLSMLLSALIWMFSVQQRRALALSNRMENELIARNKTEDKLRLAALMSQHSSEAMLVTSSSLSIVDINHAFTKVTGYTLEEIIGKDLNLYSSSCHEPAFYQLMWNEINTTGHWQGEIWSKRKNGDLYLASTTINTDHHDDGSVHRYILLFSDITQKKESEKLIWQQANFDALTGLPNRHMFRDRLSQAIMKSHRSGLPMALLLLDLDHFKEVNDTLGHAQGDVLLIEAARRIANCVRESDTVSRLGGDEFTVVLSEMKDVSNAERVAQNIIESLALPFELLQDKVHVFASIGITLYPNDSQNIEALTKNADQAMYVAKNLGGNRFSYFHKNLQEAADTRLSMMRDLRVALINQQLMVYYQPIVEIATGTIYKAEALLRWQHPVLGMVSPTQFIPLAEESGLIHEIGDWVFHEATRELANWRKHYAPDFQISVNVSPVQLRQNKAQIGLPWIRHLQVMELPGHSLSIEITEGILLNAETTVTEKLQMFRQAGVEVSIDDFGTGYSSLSYLRKFDIDYLKIDQSFVHTLVDKSNDMALCKAIIVMAHKLGLKVIAEGVETKQQRDLLASYGCDFAQGWLYAKAVPAAEFETLLLSTKQS